MKEMVQNRHKFLIVLLSILAIQAPLFASASALHVNVDGFSVEALLEPEEQIVYSFLNNLQFTIESNVSTNLSVVYFPILSDRKTAVLIENDMPLELEFKFRPRIQAFLPEFNDLPDLADARAVESYGMVFEMMSNASVGQVTIRVEVNTLFGLDPAKNYVFAIYSPVMDGWEVLETKVNENTSVPMLEASIQDMEGGESYYVSIYEAAPLGTMDAHWLLAMIIIVVALLIPFTLAISKKAYVHMLKNRDSSFPKGPHKMTLDEVLENENRNKIIDLILEEPGIHFNELLRRTGLAPGNLVWHLDVLETYRVIGKRRVTNKVVYFPYYDDNPLSNLDLQINKSSLTLEILKIIEEEPGVWSNLITKKLEVNRKTIQYHVDKLKDLGVIRFKKSGKKKLIFVNLDSEYFKQ